MSESGIGGLWRACCRANRGLRGSYACGVDTVMRCGGAGASGCADSVGECRNAGELSVRARAGCIWKEDRALGGTMCVGTLGNISDMRGKEGETGESVQAMSSSEMMLARRPRPLGGRISGDGGEGERLGDRDHGTLEICEMAPLEEGRPRPLRKCNMEAMVVIRRRRDIEMEDRDVEEIVEGECMRLGVSWTSRFWECLNLRIKDGMVRGGGRGSRRGEKGTGKLEPRLPKWSVNQHFEAVIVSARIVICNRND